MFRSEWDVLRQDKIMEGVVGKQDQHKKEGSSLFGTVYEIFRQGEIGYGK